MHQTNMLGRLKILNSRETKQILEKLEEQYGYILDKNSSKLAFLMNKDNRIYIISRDIEHVPYDEMRIDSVGMYFGELYKEHLRLSIEGAQMIGPHATKNIIELNDDQRLAWIVGADLDFVDTGKDFVIVSYKNKDSKKTEFLGCGKYKDGKLMNYVSKSRRLVVVNN